MRKPVFVLTCVSVLGLLGTPAFAGFFDWDTRSGPYTTEKVCADDNEGCRETMVYLDGQSPTEKKRDNYFYENPNKDWTLNRREQRRRNER